MLRLKDRFVCWLLGHVPRQVRSTVMGRDGHLYFRPAIRCVRCGRRELA